MTNFSTNQVMQFYVADSITTQQYKDEKAFKISFPSLGITSDKIENVEWVTLTKAVKLQPKAKKMTVTFAGDVVIGEDYAVKVSYPEVGGAGVESWTTKTAVAHAGKGATKETVVAELVAQLTKILGVDEVLTVTPVSGGFVNTSAELFINTYFISVEGKKITVGQVVVCYKNVVICVCDDRVARRHIIFLYFFNSPFSVGNS